MGSRTNPAGRLLSLSSKQCLICCEEPQFFCIGICDHPICFVCSIRLRVLCEEKECPVCRRVLEEIFMLAAPLRYREINHRSFKWNDPVGKKYGFKFQNSDASGVFYDVLAHVCPICTNEPSFDSFRQLSDHMYRKHKQIFCEICVDGLKLFSWERKAYTREELQHHEEQGDVDDQSYRGHPPCRFCRQRFLDDDDLFRHLRKDHSFCQFCDADGLNIYFNDYLELRDHCRQEHFLCEEGHCSGQQIVTSFRSEIDLKAHKAKVHGRDMKPGQLRQERQLNVEITYARSANAAAAGRGGSRGRGGGGGGREHSMRVPYYSGRDSNDDRPVDGAAAAHVRRGRGTRAGLRHLNSRLSQQSEDEDMSVAIEASLKDMNVDGGAVERPRAKSKPAAPFTMGDQEKEFPTLKQEESAKSAFGGSSAAAKWVRDNRLVRSGSLDEMEFPSLSGTAVAQDRKPAHQAAGNASVGQFAVSKGPVQAKRPVGLVMIDRDDFPSLTQSRANQRREAETAKQSSAAAAAMDLASSRARSDSQPEASSTKQNAVPKVPSFKDVIASSNAHAGSVTGAGKWSQMPSSLSHAAEFLSDGAEFPKLSSGERRKKLFGMRESSAKESSDGAWQTAQQKQKSVSNAESKPAKSSAPATTERKNPKADPAKPNVNQKQQQLSAVSPPVSAFETVGSTRPSKVEKRSVVTSSAPLHKITNDILPPPPGFELGPPPGFADFAGDGQNENSLPPGLQVQRRSEKKCASGPKTTEQAPAPLLPPGLAPVYQKPKDFSRRNFALFEKVDKLINAEELANFKVCSGEFRRDQLDAESYAHAVLGIFGLDGCLLVFPELLALLPDIGKQHALLAAFASAYARVGPKQSVKKSDENGRTSSSEVEVAQLLNTFHLQRCSVCHQITAVDDYKTHVSDHNLDAEYPALC